MPETPSELALNVAGALTTSSTAQREVTAPADITDVVAVVGTAPTGADLLFDVLKNGTTIFQPFGTLAPKSNVGTGDTTIYVEMANAGPQDIRQGQTLLIDSEQMTVSGQVQGSSKVDAANPVYAVPVTRAANGTTAATHNAGANVSPAKGRIPAGATQSATIENPPYGNAAALQPGDVVRVNVTQVGSTVAGSDLSVTVELSPR